jgi:ribonuclease HI
MDTQTSEVWKLHTDGASNARGNGVGIILESPKCKTIVQAVRCEFPATNNEIEYEALIMGLTLAHDLGVRAIEVYCDSLHVANHINELYMARDSKMVAYLKAVKLLIDRYDKFDIRQVSRDQNTQADALAAIGSMFKSEVTTNIPIIHVLSPSVVRGQETISLLEDEPSTGAYHLRRAGLPNICAGSGTDRYQMTRTQEFSG